MSKVKYYIFSSLKDLFKHISSKSKGILISDYRCRQLEYLGLEECKKPCEYCKNNV